MKLNPYFKKISWCKTQDNWQNMKMIFKSKRTPQMLLTLIILGITFQKLPPVQWLMICW
jgi:hypothetical protein